MEAKKEKIKVKVNVVPKYKEIEISFPYYVKDGGSVIKFFDKKKGIMVADYSFSKSVEWINCPEDWLAYKPTTEQEFNAKFKEVMTALIDINNEKAI